MNLEIKFFMSEAVLKIYREGQEDKIFLPLVMVNLQGKHNGNKNQ
jgi:hypothetical protein